ncbi:MAG: hypothetical protein KDB68_04490 [Planctomycetes bacterium]|nr:hypothetical protein [Planctomycetota bacterium]
MKAILLGALALLAGSLSAANINVNAGDTAGLINAINNANANSGADTIVLTNSTYSLSTALDFTYGPTALPAITSDISIEGNGAMITRGTGSFRFFYVAPSGTLSLTNLTINNGLAQGGDGGNGGGGGAGMGGAIFNEGELTLTGCVLSGNTAQGGNGGAGNATLNAGGGGGGLFYSGGDAGLNSGGGGGGRQSAGLTGGGVGAAGGAGGMPANGGGQNGEAPSVGGLGGVGNTGGGGGGSSSNSAVADGGGGNGGLGGGGGGAAGTAGIGGGNGGLGGWGGGGGAGAFEGGLNGGDGGFGGGGGAPANGGTPGAGNLGGNGGSASVGQFGGGGGGAGLGGAIFNNGGTLTLQSTTLTGNMAFGGNGGAGASGGNAGGNGSPLGGGIFNLNGTLNNSSSVVSGNTGGQDIEPQAPTVDTPSSANVSFFSADLGGTVQSDAGWTIMVRGVVYAPTSVNADPVLGGSGVSVLTISGTSGVFAIGAPALQTGTPYTFRAFATNAGGTGYSVTGTFTTATQPDVASIARFDNTPTVEQTLRWIVVFKGSGVTGLTTSNFSLVIQGETTGASIQSVTGLGTVWTVTVDRGSRNGTIQLVMANSTGVTPALTNVPFAGQSYTIGSPSKRKEESDCSTGETPGGWMTLMAALAAATVGLRLHRRRARRS